MANANPVQITNYIKVFKAKCRKMKDVHSGRMKKAYEVKGTPEYEELHKLREDLARAMGYDPKNM